MYFYNRATEDVVVEASSNQPQVGEEAAGGFKRRQSHDFNRLKASLDTTALHFRTSLDPQLSHVWNLGTHTASDTVRNVI